MARSYLKKGHISPRGEQVQEMRIQLECSFKEQKKDQAVWDVEGGGESDGDDTEEGGRCYILLELC